MGDGRDAMHRVSADNTTIRTETETTITPDERRRIISNFTGYDISPDMVRLSLVNLYLHGFSNPHIYEYDTLTSEERWNETADVVLANPPFMSPKGGIRPHKKFSISSNRSEVLFVDYIAEHLNPKGKAGIIVPEGVIFQSGTAYKDLRKMLVDNYLYAVVSLPAGVFNPYSGVKTSILLMDAALAKQTDEILFVKIDNDGFDLGAQRNPIKGGQLDDAIEVIRQFRNAKSAELPNDDSVKSSNDESGHLSNDGSVETQCIASLQQRQQKQQTPIAPQKQQTTTAPQQQTTIAHTVPKAEIAKNGDYNLTGERYKIGQDLSKIKYEIVSIGDVFNTSSGGTPLKDKNEYYLNGTIPWLRSGEVAQGYIYSAEIKITEEGLKNSSAKIFPVNTVLVAMYGATAGQVGILKFEACTNQAICGILPNDKVIPEYLYLVLKTQKDYLISLSGGGAQPNISQKIIRDLKIPLPPLSVQKEIVAEIEGYQKIIDGAKMVVENYEPKIDINPAWEMVELGKVCEVRSGGTPDRENSAYWNGTIPYIKTGQIYFNHIFEADEFITQEGLDNSSARIIPAGTILMAMYGQGVTRGRVAILEIEAAINQAVSAISADKSIIDTSFLFYQLQGLYEHLRKISDARGGNQSNLNSKLIKEIRIAIPSLNIQHQIVSRIEKEQELVNANKQLIEIFEQKIKDRIAKVWGEDKTIEEQELHMAAEPAADYKGV